MWNVKFNHKTLVLHFVYSRKKMNKQNETVDKTLKSLIYLFGGGTANHVNVIKPMLVSYLSCYF